MRSSRDAAPPGGGESGQAPHGVGEQRRGRRPADRAAGRSASGWSSRSERPPAAPSPKGRRVALVPTTTATRHATMTARSGMSYQRRHDPRHRHMAIAHHQRDADREDRDIERDDADNRPADRRQREREHEPDGQRGDDAHQQRPPSAPRRHRPGENTASPHWPRGCRARCGDERRVVVEREEDVGRRRRDRQRRDHRADRGARRSATIEAATTKPAVTAIFRTSENQKTRSGDMDHSALILRTRIARLARLEGCGRPHASRRRLRRPVSMTPEEHDR